MPPSLGKGWEEENFSTFLPMAILCLLPPLSNFNYLLLCFISPWSGVEQTWGRGQNKPGIVGHACHCLSSPLLMVTLSSQNISTLSLPSPGGTSGWNGVGGRCPASPSDC